MALAVASSLLAAVSLRAEPLAKEACDGLAAEQEKLVGAGVKDRLAQGPKGALARLGTDKLAQVERYILIDEQLVFRCGLFKTRTILAPDVEEAAPDAPQSGPDAKPIEAAAQPAAAQPAAKTAATKPPAKAANPDAKKEKSAAAAPQAKPKPQSPPAKKPKADDAFHPSATE
jgi:hypothetical protein